MRRFRPLALVIASVLAVSGLAACNRGREATVPRASTTTTRPSAEAPTIVASDYSFSVSGPLTADRTTIAMRNEGNELHEWHFARLRPGVDINEAAAAVQASLEGGAGGTTTTTAAGGATSERTTTSRASRSGVRPNMHNTTTTTEPPTTTTSPPTTAPPTTAAPTTRAPTTAAPRATTTTRRGVTTTAPRRTTTTRPGQTPGSTIPDTGTGIDDVFENADLGAPGSLLSPGEANTVSGDLDPGSYAVMCMIRASDGVSHVAKGMIAQVEVEDAGDQQATDPPADRTVNITDGKIDVGAKDFKVGRTTFEVTNGGEENHNFAIVALNEAETLRSVGRYVGAAFTGAPPATAPGRIVASADTLEPGDRVKVALDLKPGTYTVACMYRTEGTEDHITVFGEQTTITVT